MISFRKGVCKKRDHLVNWEVVCRPKSHGGLGIGRLKEKNIALLSK